MVTNIEFRKRIREMLEDDTVDDDEIIGYVLEFAWEQYPRPLMIWFLKKIVEWELF